MAFDDQQRRLHLSPRNTKTVEGYTARSAGGDVVDTPSLDRRTQARQLLAQFARIAEIQQQRVVEHRKFDLQSVTGIQVEFESYENVHLASERLARDRQGIELLNVRQASGRIMATVFVPEGKLGHFENLISAYQSYKTNKSGGPLDNQSLIDAIHTVRVATFDSLWTDSVEALPSTDNEVFWWEVWIPGDEHDDARLQDFSRVARNLGLVIGERILRFPERFVLQLFGSKNQLLVTPALLNIAAELRRAKTTAEFFTSLPLNEQADWSESFRARLVTEHLGNSYVTLLDTGVNHGHPLLAQLVADQDRHSIYPAWGLHDEDGHGTELAGLALLGDLTSALSDDSIIEVPHRLESVKILRGSGDNEGESYGAITAEAVARVEVTDPHRRRVFAMAVSSTDGRDRGRPSSWSAEIDRLAYNYENNGVNPRLFILCAGNTADNDAWCEYPSSLSTNSIHDPGQAWNALTVGAYTERTTISETDATSYEAIAPAGGLSPYTTTSSTWQPAWPFKPGIVVEGGNAAIDSVVGFACAMDSLSLLTTGHQPEDRLLTLSWATSAATAIAAGIAARIRASYPALWPESIRALIVHSARWTSSMLDEYLPSKIRTRQNIRQLLRHCGYGVPSLERALYSAGNSLTMILEDQIRPYHKVDGTIRTCDMHLHALPWPTELLEALGYETVSLRVTLSYFIEPNPGELGGIDKYAYQSHALRFAIRRPLESEALFRTRINAQAAAEDGAAQGGAPADAGWTIGERARARGSLISDCWTGTAVELANRGQLAIFPAMGWWRNRPRHRRFDHLARYALIVSIEAPETELDLYAAVAQQISVTITV